jgi:hypothetical protein
LSWKQLGRVRDRIVGEGRKTGGHPFLLEIK